MLRSSSGTRPRASVLLMDCEIRPLDPSEWSRAQQLVAASGLPIDDLRVSSSKNFLAAVEGDQLVGTVAVESIGSDSLLRSLAVDPAKRGNGIGRKLVRAAEEKSRKIGATRIFLFTNTAAEFFASVDYRRVPREAASEAIRNHAQFRTLCPASAAFMEKNLEPESLVRVLFL